MQRSPAHHVRPQAVKYGVAVQFSFDGRKFEVDLVEANVAKLEKALKPFTDKGRETTPANGIGVSQNQKVRDWLQANNYDVSNKGKIPSELQEVYDSHHPQEETLTTTQPREVTRVLLPPDPEPLLRTGGLAVQTIFRNETSTIRSFLSS